MVIFLYNLFIFVWIQHGYSDDTVFTLVHGSSVIKRFWCINIKFCWVPRKLCEHRSASQVFHYHLRDPAIITATDVQLLILHFCMIQFTSAISTVSTINSIFLFKGRHFY